MITSKIKSGEMAWHSTGLLRHSFHVQNLPKNLKNNKCIHSTHNQISRSFCTKKSRTSRLHNQVREMEKSVQIRKLCWNEAQCQYMDDISPALPILMWF